MASKLEERSSAIAATESTCPRCGATREPDQRYCLECGLPLPGVEGTVPGLRRRWLRRLGWYPGDWVWISILTLLVAIAGATVAIVLTQHRKAQGATFRVSPSTAVTVHDPTANVPTTPTNVDTSTLPAAPEPGTTKTKTKPKSHNGRLAWPAKENGWTIVLVSYPKSTGRPSALSTADRAVKAGLRQVGILDSGSFASLQPGYYVVFAGIYGSKSDADAGVGTARGAGFGGAYSRQVAR